MQCGAGTFVVLAIDHRANLREALDAAAPAPLSDAEFTAFKLQVIDALGDVASAVLIDPDYGMAQGIISGVIRCGVLAPLEVTDYDLHPDQRGIQFIEGWSVEKIKRAGASGVKLLMNYHPEGESATQKRAIVRRIAQECQQHEIPFFLEPLAYTLNGEHQSQVIVESAATFSRMGVDVLKLEYADGALDEVNAACGNTPWVLLSAGVDFDTFLVQTEAACKAGASGVIAGRAIWAEAVTLQGVERADFLHTTAHQRMTQLAEVCAAYAVDWRTKVQQPVIKSGWYRDD
jgi:tagatose-1,6-bisphosphate aldolase